MLQAHTTFVDSQLTLAKLFSRKDSFIFYVFCMRLMVFTILLLPFLFLDRVSLMSLSSKW